jgi:hypothetical protein
MDRPAEELASCGRWLVTMRKQFVRGLLWSGGVLVGRMEASPGNR